MPRCPVCSATVDLNAVVTPPFCSERCKLVDLGTWFNEEQRISRDLRPGDFGEFEDLPPGMHLDKPE